ncbi:MAG: DUF4301 family protein [Bacteroidetes bacterium]|jgi:hypothetical protein|nr:DUF4301 family protein [Bacteroidota bacterium]MBT6684875.1 DUF4301 family protein [Bacteroidota bacterium]MBT7142569.1 DUF4301 family protein [Bacteroidota bacterium]MBT7493266.1 DUF4301 family protein [Bacteroidota bacterium]
MFTEKNLQQFGDKGINEKNICQQIENFKNGFPYLNLVKPATYKSGIVKLDEKQLQKCIKLYDKELKIKQAIKFVPASGAASRMFKALFELISSRKKSEEDYMKQMTERGFHSVGTFFENIQTFAFYNDLREVFLQNNGNIDVCYQKKNYIKIVETLLNEDGLNYGKLPKGLLRFHKYSGYARTSFTEHLVEAAHFCKNADETVKVHFTISPEHKQLFINKFDEIKEQYEDELKVQFEISFSFQKSSTDTIAVDLENKPFVEDDEKILFRPGGHGALIENLNDIDADIIFIKNIDNIAPDRIRDETYIYKKALAGVLLAAQKKVFEYLELLENENAIDLKTINKIAAFLQKELFITLNEDFDDLENAKKIKYLKSKLNRPFRVCGMVKNEGEPGGGPFYTKCVDGSTSLQIVESSQIDKSDENQNEILLSSTHFNPVDLVCSIIDYKGQKFDLSKFVDGNTGFISQKSKDGRDLKAQELPGLWNGAMANWNTIFVEVPISTFNPVKVINDLLREEHQA